MKLLYRPVTVMVVFLLLICGPAPTQASHPVPAAAGPSWELDYDSDSGTMMDMEVYDNALYVGASVIGQTDGRLYRKDGVTWADMHIAAITGARVDMVQALKTFNNRLYIGLRENVGGIDYARVYAYDGQNFVLDFSTHAMAGYSAIGDLIVHNGTLYATNGSPYAEVYQRLGEQNWVVVGGGPVQASNPVNALASYDGWLYAGTGTYSFPEAKVWRWNGSDWVEMVNLSTAEFDPMADGVASMQAYDNYLFASTGGPGYSTTATSIFSFDGLEWKKETTFDGCDSVVLSLVHGEIWASTCKGAIYHREAEGQWTQLGTIPEIVFGYVVQYGHDLYAAVRNDGLVYRAPDPESPSGEITAPLDYATTGSGATVPFTATAWTASPNGIRAVAFDVFYDGAWHSLGSATSAPYETTWTPPAQLESQEVLFGIHVTDNDGATTRFAGGVHHVYYIDSIGRPGIINYWVPNRAYLNQRSLSPLGDYKCSVSSMAMVLAMNGLIGSDYTSMADKANAMYPNVLDGGVVSSDLMTQELVKQGLAAASGWYSIPDGWAKIKAEIDAGRPVIIRTAQRIVTTPVHFVVGVGYREEGNTRSVIVYDPYGKWKGTVDVYNANDPDNPLSHKGRWVFYDFDTIFGSSNVLITGSAAVPAQVAGLAQNQPLTPPDRTSAEPETIRLYWIALSEFIFLPNITR